jgi:phosphoesterase RecJ-like protein
MIVTQENFASTGALQEHTEGFVDLPRTIEGVEISILFSELEKNNFKLSLRSKGRFDVERVARKWGGGGHVNASGCRIKGDIATIKRLVLAQIEAVG